MKSTAEMKSRDEQINFIRLNGVSIAGCAWNSYLVRGRGMICILIDLQNELLKQVPFDFLPAGDAARLIESWDGSREQQMVTIYDPEKEVVVCFVKKDDDDRTQVDCYKIQTNPTPPVAADES